MPFDEVVAEDGTDGAEDGLALVDAVLALVDAAQLAWYDVTPLTLCIEHDQENEFVQPARAVLHRFVPVPSLT